MSPPALSLPAPCSVARALAAARDAGLPTSEARYLLGALLQRDRAWLITHDADTLSAAQAERWSHWVAQRLDGVPQAYLSGEHEFHGLRLAVTPAVLDPRPDTETLVDWALAWLAERAAAGLAAPRVLDLGTGSGAIALALQHGWPAATVVAVERSPAALAVARGNGARLGLAIDWRAGSWFAPLAADDTFDLIVGNPPYIAAADPHLPALRHEPHEALVAGVDGLDDLRLIVAQAPAHLRPGGWLMLEHGHDQAAAMHALLHDHGYGPALTLQDLAGRDRCSGAARPAQLDP